MEHNSVEDCVRFTSIPSSAISVSGISKGNISRLLGGSGEGEQGLRGCLSVECMEEGHDGVVGLGVMIVEQNFGVSLDVRNDGWLD